LISWLLSRFFLVGSFARQPPSFMDSWKLPISILMLLIKAGLVFNYMKLIWICSVGFLVEFARTVTIGLDSMETDSDAIYLRLGLF
jgi:hypothetical protein